jgi:hypothetical protein
MKSKTILAVALTCALANAHGQTARPRVGLRFNNHAALPHRRVKTSSINSRAIKH